MDAPGKSELASCGIAIPGGAKPDVVSAGFISPEKPNPVPRPAPRLAPREETRLAPRPVPS